MLLVLALVLTQALAIQASVFHSTHPATDLEALCAGKDVDLTEFDQLVALRASISARQTSSCSPNTKKAIVDLASLIERTNGDLCAASSIEALHGFYAEYLDSSSSEEYEKLPKSLKRFALAYGMQMSNSCKKNMVKVLTEEARQILSPEDFEQVTELVGDEGPVAEVLGVMGGPDEIFLPGDLAPFMRKHGIEPKGYGDKIFMQTATSSFIKHLQAVCERRFRPLYEPLMMPLVQLSNMGFNYKDEPLKCDLKCPTVVKEVGQWSRIVFLCESLTTIQIVEDKNDGQLAEGTGTKVVRILTKEEAAAIGGPLTNPEEDESVEKVVYTPQQLVALEGQILDRSNKALSKSIKSFKTSQSEEDAIRKRMLTKGLSIVKRQLKKGNVGMILSATYKGLLHKYKGKEVANPTEQMIKNLDEIIEQQQQGTSLDAPVSGVGGTILMQLVLIVIAIGFCALVIWVLFAIATLIAG